MDYCDRMLFRPCKLNKKNEGEFKMLKEKTETRSINAYGYIGETQVCAFSATIDSQYPENMDVNRSIINRDMYKANRIEMMKDQTAFEDSVYALQDEMIAVNKPVESETE